MKNNLFKRILAVMLVVLMIIPSSLSLIVFAEDWTVLKTSVQGLEVKWRYYEQRGGSATWSASDKSITCTAKGETLKSNTSEVTLTNLLDSSATLSFNCSQDGGTLRYINNGENSFDLDSKESITFTFKSKASKTGEAKLEITDISLIPKNVKNPEIKFLLPEKGGSYTVDGVAVSSEFSKTYSMNSSVKVKATSYEGFTFFAWYDSKNDVYLSYNSEAQIVAIRDAEIVPIFISADTAIFTVAGEPFTSLSEAGAVAAAGSSKTIILANNGTVSGNHTIPAGTTLLIPYDANNTAYGANAVCTSTSESFLDSSKGFVAWVKPTVYRTLKLASDANITVNGNIEVGGRHAAASGGTGMYGGSPTGPLGYINMSKGSHIEFNSGSKLYCWGYIYGDGTITAKNGSEVFENFQIMDFRGGTETLSISGDGLVFPLSQYYVQNIEVETTYEYGSKETVVTSIFASKMCTTASVNFIGDTAMFRPGKNSYVVKDYDPQKDELNLDAYGDCALASIQLEISLGEIDSSDFALPITNNINIGIHNGIATLKQNMMLLPGSSLTVHEGATLNISETTATNKVYQSGGHILQIFDSVNWTKALDDNLSTVTNLNFVHPSRKFRPIQYTATNRYTRTENDLTDVTVDINGTVITDGYIYSTVWLKNPSEDDFTIVDGGANVISSSKKGSVVMNNGAGQDVVGVMYDQSKDSYFNIPIASVQLKNGDGTYLDTTGAAEGATYNYCSTHDKWYTGECETCASAPIKYEITWVVNGDSSTSDVDADTSPVYPGGTPVKAANDTYHYIFAGWSKTENGSLLNTIPVASANATYYAVFSPAQHSFKSEVVNGYHACKEATCGKKASCSDADGDGDHACDLGCNSVLTECKGGTASCKDKAVCDECKQPYGDYAKCKPGAAKEENRIEATCGKPGSYNNVVRCTVCNDVIKSVSVEIPASGNHSDGTDKNHDCDVCGEPNVSNCVGGDPVFENVTDSTCNAGGSYDKVVYCTVCEAKMSSETVTTQSSGHTWSPVTYKWSNDYKSCTATRTCTRDSSHVESETVQSVSSIKTDATCTDKGWTTYTATFVAESEWAAVQTKDVQDIKKAPHGSVKGFIYEDLKNGTHKIICNDCKNILDTVEHEFENNHECVCGAVDTFDLTILDWNSENVEFAVIKVPFGAKIEDYIKDVVISDIKTENGVYKFNGEWYSKNSDKEADDVPETMPGENLTIYANLNYTGWLQSGDGWIYDVDDVTMYGWYCVDGSWYYLDEETGYRATDITRVPYPTEAINGITYGPVAEDKAYWESHKSSSKYTDAETARFIFDEDGKFNSFTGIVENERYAVNGMIGWHIGLVDVNGDYYYFKGDDKTNGGNIMAKGDVYVTRIASGDAEIGGCYTFGVDGKLCKYDGITKVNNVLRYYDDARLVMDKGLIKVGEYYYYIRSNGDLVVDSEYYVPAEKLNGYDIVEGKYTFDENGRMIRPIDPSVYNGIVEIDGKYYYYENGKQLKNKGVVELKDNDGVTFYIYIRSNGELATGDYWPTKRNKLLPAGVYDWGADGKYYPAVPSFATGIYEINGEYYYYVDGVKQKNAGVVKLTDENQKVFYIYVRYNGKLATGNYWPTNRNNLLSRGIYNWGDDGKYYPVIPEFATGIYEINGEYYYYVDGVKQKNAGVVKLTDENQNDFYIYVRYNGKLAKGNYWPTNRNNLLSRGVYDWGADGRYYPA